MRFNHPGSILSHPLLSTAFHRNIEMIPVNRKFHWHHLQAQLLQKKICCLVKKARIRLTRFIYSTLDTIMSHPTDKAWKKSSSSVLASSAAVFCPMEVNPEGKLMAEPYQAVPHPQKGGSEKDVNPKWDEMRSKQASKMLSGHALIKPQHHLLPIWHIKQDDRLCLFFKPPSIAQVDSSLAKEELHCTRVLNLFSSRGGADRMAQCQQAAEGGRGKSALTQHGSRLPADTDEVFLRRRKISEKERTKNPRASSACFQKLQKLCSVTSV